MQMSEVMLIDPGHQSGVGSIKRLELLYDKYASALYGALVKIVEDEIIANSLLEESFIKIWKAIEAHENYGQILFSQMLQITRDTGDNFIKSNNLKYTDSAIAVKRPDLNYQQIIDLMYFKKYSQEELSEILGVAIGDIKTEARKAILALRENRDI